MSRHNKLVTLNIYGFEILIFVFQIFLYIILHFSAFVQLLQYYYQKGCLYRLKCLGQRHDMDITVGKFVFFNIVLIQLFLPLN